MDTQVVLDNAVTIMVQTRVAAGADAQFRAWQAGIAAVTAQQPGFIDQSLVPPNPPMQADWVVINRFRDLQSASAWLSSPVRLQLVTEAQPFLIGVDDVKLVTGGGERALPAPIAVVFTTQLKPGGEAAFRIWQQKVAAAQAVAPGFQGYRFEPPIPGVQQDWLAILRFDSEQNLQSWMKSPARLALLAESDLFTAKLGTNVVRTGFEQWFAKDAGGAAPSAWKQNMIVVSMLYPTVFLFGTYVQGPWLMTRLHMAFWSSLIIANTVGVLLLNEFVPALSRRLAWWLKPGVPPRTSVAGAAVVGGLCVGWMALFYVLSRP